MDTETIDGKTVESWTPKEVQEALDRHEIIVIDVRTPPEYMIEHVPGALLMPLSFFDPRSIPTHDRRVVFHCGSGVRSERVARMMLAAGQDVVAHMAGGFGAWKQAELPYVGTDMATGAPRRMP